MDQRGVKKAKTINYVVSFILLSIIVTSIIFFFVHKYSHIFTAEKWLKDPQNRVDLIDDLLSKYNLVGMNEKEILTLLGKGGGENAYFQDDSNFVYYLGDERGLISIDSEWLIVEFSNGIVNKVRITTD